MSFLSFRRKKEPPPNEPSGSRICMILANQPEPPPDTRVTQAVAHALGPRARVTEAKDGVWMLDVKGLNQAFFSLISAPIPTGEAEDAADSFMWPSGARFAGHRCHIIVAALAAKGKPVATMLALTKLACAALEAFDGAAVYWGAGAITVPRESFIDMAQQASAEHLPLFLWVRFQPFRPGEERCGLYTVGLDQFGLMEIEVDDSTWAPAKLLEFTFNVAHYLVQQGPVIKDGDTVGGSEDERIYVAHLPSVRTAGRNVYKILVDRSGAGA